MGRFKFKKDLAVSDKPTPSIERLLFISQLRDQIEKPLGVIFAMTLTSLASGCSTTDTIAANTDSYAVDQLFAKGDTVVDNDSPAIAIRYPASITLASSESDAETYERIVKLTDANLTSGAFFVAPGDVNDAADLGTFFMRSTLLKSRLTAHAVQANIKTQSPEQLVFTQPMDLVIHPVSSGKGECHTKRGDDEGDASFCLEVKSAATVASTPVNIIMDVAAFNDYNLTTYGLNSYRSLGHEISPMVSVGRFEFNNGSYGGPHFTFFDGIKGGLPEDTSMSAFPCLFKKCKGKPKSRKGAFKQKPIAFAEDTMFNSLAPLTSLALESGQAELGNYTSLVARAKASSQSGSSGIPALMDSTSTEMSIEFLKMENQFQNERSEQTAALFQDNLYQTALSSLDGEEVFSQKIRKVNKSKRTDSALSIFGAAAAMTGALAAADLGDTAMTQQMLGNIDLFENYIDLSEIETEGAIIEFSDEARAIEDQIGRINLDSQDFELGVEQSAGSISELRDIQLELLKRSSKT